MTVILKKLNTMLSDDDSECEVIEGDRSDDDNDNDDAQFQRPTRPKNELNPNSLGFQQVCATTEKTCDIVSWHNFLLHYLQIADNDYKMVSAGGEIINLAAYERLQFKVNDSSSFVDGKISGTACITSIVVDQSNVKHFGIRSTRRLASVNVDSNGDSR